MTGMGMDWDPEVTGEVIEQWAALGASPATPTSCARRAWPRPSAPSSACPRGVHTTVIELQPEAPIAHHRNEETP